MKNLQVSHLMIIGCLMGDTNEAIVAQVRSNFPAWKCRDHNKQIGYYREKCNPFIGEECPEQVQKMFNIMQFHYCNDSTDAEVLDAWAGWNIGTENTRKRYLREFKRIAEFHDSLKESGDLPGESSDSSDFVSFDGNNGSSYNPRHLPVVIERKADLSIFDAVATPAVSKKLIQDCVAFCRTELGTDPSFKMPLDVSNAANRGRIAKHHADGTVTRKSHMGKIVTKGRRGFFTNEFTVTSRCMRIYLKFMGKRQTLAELISTAAHETVHLDQIARGDLDHGIMGYQTWKGELVLEAYEKRPHEIEARAKEKPLARKFMEHAIANGLV